MLNEIMKDMPMSRNCESDWYSFVQDSYKSKQNKAIAGSMQIIWAGAAGNLDGKLQIIVSNDGLSSSVAYEFEINSVTNINDCLLVLLMPNFRFYKLKYIANNINAGILNAFVYYSRT